MSAPQDSQLIEARAHQIWEREGKPDGRAQEHWRRAEQELETEFRIAVPDATGNEDPGSDLASDDEWVRDSGLAGVTPDSAGRSRRAGRST
jgi:hypothetical protein